MGWHLLVSPPAISLNRCDMCETNQGLHKSSEFEGSNGPRLCLTIQPEDWASKDVFFWVKRGTMIHLYAN